MACGVLSKLMLRRKLYKKKTEKKSEKSLCFGNIETCFISNMTPNSLIIQHLPTNYVYSSK